MERLDVLLVKKGMFPSRQKAIEAIKLGQVFVEETKKIKPSEKFEEEVNIKITGDNLKYVSRGGFKLEKMISEFNLNFKNAVVLDMGSSTGGFTDCALKNGAKKVFAVDVGSNQLVESLKQDKRVISLENTDIRNISEDVINECNIVVGDLSFISIVKILDAIKPYIKTQILALLIKPQFECGVELSKKYKGVIKDYNLSKKICFDVLNKIKDLGFNVHKVSDSPIKGGDGNNEFIALISK